MGTMTIHGTIYWVVIKSTRGSRRLSTSQRENSRTAPFSWPLGECHGMTCYCFIYHCFIVYVFAIVYCRRIVNGQCPHCSLKRDDATRPASRDNCELATLAVVSNERTRKSTLDSRSARSSSDVLLLITNIL